MRLDGAKILVTGGAKRIGKKICEAFAKEGAKIIIHFNQSEADAKALLQKLEGKEKGHSIWQCDLSKDFKIDKKIHKILPFDILINNASIYEPKQIINETESEIQKNMSVNFFSPLFLAIEFAKYSTNGLIINILDECVARLSKDEGSYQLSKKCLLWATEILALQLAPKIRVNAIAPGAVLPPDDKPEMRLVKQKHETPLRKTATLDDIVSACIFLAKNDSITGQTIFIDGGRHLL
ncbi:MAG: SDR family oxidoreductase [Candidatus Nanoarchaeia archaeon]